MCQLIIIIIAVIVKSRLGERFVEAGGVAELFEDAQSLASS